MNPFIFNCPTKVCFAEGSSSAVAEHLADLGAKSPFVVTDEFLLKNKITDTAVNALEERFGKVGIYSEVPPDSDLDCINKVAKMAKDAGADSVVAIGGGSVIDTAKVVNICLSLGGDILDHQGLNAIETKLLPLIVIPTTAGTGSEVSYVAMIKHHEEKRKIVFGSKFLAPDIALLDPLMQLSLPAKLTAATGMDALTHAIESVVCEITGSSFSDALAIEAARMIFKWLPIATADGGDIEARSNMLVASCMAGSAFSNAGVGVVHALAHSTGARFNTHHGLTNAIFLPHGIRFNQSAAAVKYAQLSRQLGFSKTLDDNEGTATLIDSVENLLKQLNLPSRLELIGVPKLSESELEAWANDAVDDPSTMFNPKELTVQDAIEIYKRAY